MPERTPERWVIRLFLLFLIVSLFGSGSSLSLEPVIVVVSAENPIREITAEELREIYLGENKKWKDGSPIVPLNLVEKHPASVLFRENILKKTAADLTVFWIQQIFSEKGSPPVILKEDSEVKAYISSNKGAIGYIRSSAADATVKPISVDGKAFLQ